ncbi:ABC transporter substrate-binding protein [Oceanicola sp. S124]|uniref:ABC transporter substrate-binding protein n=1 Tax=Oceanicola sp. S124 TaxID=1042378 RepID=UPI000255975A|nr:ABC transporter substrate-binding protein [Oceanicola sp. S124]
MAARAEPAPEAVRSFGAGREIVLRTTTDIDVMAPAIAQFLDSRPGLAIRYEQWGSNNLYDLTLAECASGQPGAGLVISSAVHHLVKLVNDGCAAPWVSAATAAVPDALTWRNEIWGITREPAVIVYNRALVPASEVPRSRFDLLDLLRPERTPYAGRVATYDIEASGLGFLFAFMDSQEATTFGALMEAFARTEAVATCCSAEIIEGVQRGHYLIAYNVLGSYAQTRAAEDPMLGIVAPSDYTLVLSRAAILPGRQADADAGALLDYLLGPEGQLVMARNRLVGLDPLDADPDDAEEAGRQVPIGLGLPLLLAMDRAKVAQFTARWRDAFGPGQP